MAAIRPSLGSKSKAWSARWGRVPSVAGYSDSGSWKKVCSWTLSQPSRAYSTMRRPLETLPVPVSGGHAELTASRRLEHPEIPVAQIESAIGDALTPDPTAG